MVSNNSEADIAGIHLAEVTAWVQAQVADIVPPLSFALIAGGHSNLTYRFTDARGEAYVLRRPPLGHVLESAHDMGREHRIVAALQSSAVPVAPALGLCTDTTVNDAPFYLMKFVEGAVLHDAEAAQQLSNPARQAVSQHVVDVLAALHSTEPETVGLGDLGRKEAYLARQLKRWNKQWVATKTHEIPAMEATERMLQERMPEQIGAAIVHGDYRLGNMMVRDGQVAAVLDWELCTLGDPLADVGYLLNNWLQPAEEGSEKTPTGAGGFFTREALVAAYGAATGRDLSQINYYRAFSHWRLAAISQGVYKRYLVGAMGEDHDLDLELHKQGVHNRAEAALALMETGGA